MIGVDVKIYGLGENVTRSVTAEGPLTCGEALRLAREEGKDDILLMNVTYLVNGAGAGSDSLLNDGDTLYVLSILGGG